MFLKLLMKFLTVMMISVPFAIMLDINIFFIMAMIFLLLEIFEIGRDTKKLEQRLAEQAEKEVVTNKQNKDVK